MSRPQNNFNPTPTLKKTYFLPPPPHPPYRFLLKKIVECTGGGRLKKCNFSQNFVAWGEGGGGVRG